MLNNYFNLEGVTILERLQQYVIRGGVYLESNKTSKEENIDYFNTQA